MWARAAGLRGLRLPLPKGTPVKGFLAEGQLSDMRLKLLLLSLGCPPLTERGADDGFPRMRVEHPAIRKVGYSTNLEMLLGF